MSTLKTNNVQVGQSVTATNNFTLYQPATPDGTVRLGVGNSGATTSDVITANSSGNVGFGTSSPLSRVDVRAPAGELGRFAISNAGVGYLLVGGGGATAEGLRLSYDNTDGSSTINNYYNAALKFSTNNTERARIDASGNFFINQSSTVTPGQSNVPGACFRGASSVYTLEVNGGANQAAIFGRTGDGQVMRFYNSTTFAGFINLSSNTTAYSSVSDYRLKENIQPMTGALARVAALKPCTYKWKVDGSAGQGFIAHELAQVVPDCVSGEKDGVETYTDAGGNEQTRPVYQGVDTSFLVATLTAAIQEQQALITSLTARIAALEAK